QAPLKEPHLANPVDRLNMLELAIEGHESFETSALEIERGGVSYTVDTARYLYGLFGERPFFLVGADSFLSLHLWKRPEELTSLARFVVVDREGMHARITSYVRDSFSQLEEGKDFFLISVRRIDLSSTEIRERVKRGASIRWMVPERVEEYIKSRRLYL
ncbi:MAG: nicotinate (nicotinamide) nucleotide adenylyltransferase, partial [Aquificaceae bacterium]|nr:nicotinate (nicotinamide) nucleotide adenylyltransferase [Aquificaceae bacterium]